MALALCLCVLTSFISILPPQHISSIPPYGTLRSPYGIPNSQYTPYMVGPMPYSSHATSSGQGSVIGGDSQTPQPVYREPPIPPSGHTPPMSMQGRPSRGLFEPASASEVARRSNRPIGRPVIPHKTREKNRIIDLMRLDLQRTVDPALRKLLATMISFIDGQAQSEMSGKSLPDLAELCNGVRFFASRPNGGRLLYREWVLLYDMEPKYLELTPKLVCDVYRDIKPRGSPQAPSMVQSLSVSQVRKERQIQAWAQEVSGVSIFTAHKVSMSLRPS